MVREAVGGGVWGRSGARETIREMLQRSGVRTEPLPGRAAGMLRGYP